MAGGGDLGYDGSTITLPWAVYCPTPGSEWRWGVVRYTLLRADAYPTTKSE